MDHAGGPQLQHPNNRRPLFWVLGIAGGGCLLFMALMVLGVLVAFRQIESSTSRVRKSNQSLLEARAGHRTVLQRHRRIGGPIATPPADLFQTVKYRSPVGELSAYLSHPADNTAKQPVIIWLFGGFDNSIGDTAWLPAPVRNDQSASDFRRQGIVMMYPSLRGGNDNPGRIEAFYGEVDDVLAAADFLADQQYVDANRIYLGGHSTGATLAILCAAASDRFRAVFAFGPVDSVAGYGAEALPFRYSDSQEHRFRNPIDWLHAIKTPLFAIEGSEGNASCLVNMQSDYRNKNISYHIIDGASHFNVLAPVTRLLAKKIVADDGPNCNIRLTDGELQSLFH